MKFGSSGFLVGLSVVFKGNPEGHKQDADDDNCRYSSAEGCPIEL